jgi:hypothetical protein
MFNFIKSIKNYISKKREVVTTSTVYTNGIFYGDSNSLDDSFLFDFKNYSSQYNGPSIGIATGIVTEEDIGGAIGSQKPENKKLFIKPIDVLKELETVPNPFSLSNIDGKIEMLKMKEKLITQKYAKREVTALIQRLENRKKYDSFKEFFSQFQNTTDEKIDVILGKYKLVMKTSDIFIPEFPDEAIHVMQKYTEEMEKVCEKKPVFYVIAEEEKFHKSYEKRDPILLVQSPFGFYWQILGAWDKEMLLLSEL